MIKMINRQDKRIAYWEVWEHDRKLFVHDGFVGDTGTTTTINLQFLQNAERVMAKLAKEMLHHGYRELCENDLTQFVIRYDGNGEDLSNGLEKRHRIESHMNECLGWSGNGDCDGGDIGINDGDINIFCYVIDVNQAIIAVKNELQAKNLLDGAKLAYRDEHENYVTVYPEGAVFELSVL